MHENLYQGVGADHEHSIFGLAPQDGACPETEPTPGLGLPETGSARGLGLAQPGPRSERALCYRPEGCRRQPIRRSTANPHESSELRSKTAHWNDSPIRHWPSSCCCPRASFNLHAAAGGTYPLRQMSSAPNKKPCLASKTSSRPARSKPKATWTSAWLPRHEQALAQPGGRMPALLHPVFWP